jgi:hypothetical protein
MVVSAIVIAVEGIVICIILGAVIVMWIFWTTHGDVSLLDDALGLVVICIGSHAMSVYFRRRIKEIKLMVNYLESVGHNTDMTIDQIHEKQREAIASIGTGDITKIP